MLRGQKATPTHLRDLVGEWEVGSLADVSVDDRGTRNRIWFLTTDRGRFVLREYTYTPLEEIERQHRLLRFVSERDIPTPPPLVSRAGTTIVARDGCFYSVFPHAKGSQVDRSSVSGGHLAAMGHFLGRLNRVLREVPASLVRDRTRSTDVDRALDRIDQMEVRIRSLQTSSEQDEWLLQRLQGRRQFVVSNRSTSLSAFDALPRQAVHGDFQDQNLFFENCQVSAIIDWDGAYMAPQAWDAVRVIDIVTGGDVSRSCVFLERYLEILPTSMDILDKIAWARAWTDALSLWLYEEIYEHGNDRLYRFASPPPFESSYVRWCRVREELASRL